MAELEADLSLNVDPALAALGQVDDAFEQVVAAFQSGLAEAIATTVNTPLDIDAHVDSEVLTAEAETALASAEAAPQIDRSGLAAEIDAAVAAADTEIPVTADTTQFTEDIEAALPDVDLAEATGGVQDLTGSITGLSDAASGAARGDLPALIAGVGGITAKAAPALAAVTGLGAVIGVATSEAANAERALFRLNRTFGTSAEQIEQVDIGGLNESLSDLALRTGQSDEGLRLAAAAIGDLGRSSGAATDDIADTAEQILVLATRSAVLRPELGAAGEQATALVAALARGGRAAARFGIDLDIADVVARAATNTGKLAEETTIYERAAAGAQIVTEQLGERIATDIGEGTATASSRLAQLRTALSETLEAAGGPLLEAFLELAEEGTGAAQSLAAAFGELAAAVLPLAVGFAQALSPVLQAVATLLDAIPTPVLQAAAAFIAFRAAASGLIAVLGLVAPALAASLGPFGAAAAAAGAIAVAFGFLGDSAEATTPVLPALAEEILAVRNAASGAQPEVEGLTENVRGLLEAGTLGTFGEELLSGNTLTQLRQLGLDMETILDLLEQGDLGFGRFRARIEGAFGKTNTAIIFGPLLDAFQEQQKALQASAKTALELRVQTGVLTRSEEERFNGLLDVNQAQANYAGLLDEVLDREAELDDATASTTRSILDHEIATRGLVDTLGSADLAFGGLAQAILDGKLAAEQFPAAATALGVSTGQVEEFANRLTTAVQGFVDTAVSNLPRAADAFAGLDDDIDVSEVRRKLDQITVDTITFIGNIQRIQEGGFEDTIRLLASLPAAQAAAVAQQLVEAGPQFIEDFEESIDDLVSARDWGEFVFRDIAPDVILRSGETADDVTEIFGERLKFDEGIDTALNFAEAALLANEEVRAAALKSGLEVGEDFADAVIAGVQGRSALIDAAVARLLGQQVSGPGVFFRNQERAGDTFDTAPTFGESPSAAASRVGLAGVSVTQVFNEKVDPLHQATELGWILGNP